MCVGCIVLIGSTSLIASLLHFRDPLILVTLFQIFQFTFPLLIKIFPWKALMINHSGIDYQEYLFGPLSSGKFMLSVSCSRQGVGMRCYCNRSHNHGQQPHLSSKDTREVMVLIWNCLQSGSQLKRVILPREGVGGIN